MWCLPGSRKGINESIEYQGINKIPRSRRPKGPVVITTNLNPPMGIDISRRINGFTFSSSIDSRPKAERRSGMSVSFPCWCDLSVVLPHGQGSTRSC